jgi:hypothetical protein
MAIHAARRYMRDMGQPYTRGEAGKALLDQAAVDVLAAAAGNGG